MSLQPIKENTLFNGENLNILRGYIPRESVDLKYLDPPFATGADFSFTSYIPDKDKSFLLKNKARFSSCMI